MSCLLRITLARYWYIFIVSSVLLILLPNLGELGANHTSELDAQEETEVRAKIWEAIKNAHPGDELSAVAALSGVFPPVHHKRKRGEGPFDRMVLRGGIVIRGAGAPPFGPVDIVIENNRIVEVRNLGAPYGDIDPLSRPAPGDKEIDCQGMYILPGFVDTHEHLSSLIDLLWKAGPLPPADYFYKLWLAHGITTVRDAGCLSGLTWTLSQKKKSKTNEIAAPRIYAYAALPMGDWGPKFINTPEQARKWIQDVAKKGADGIKFFSAPRKILKEALDECKKLGLRTMIHHVRTFVTEYNVLDTARWGLDSCEHMLSIPEAMFTDRLIQEFPSDYNYNDERDRFLETASAWQQAAKPESKKWHEVINKLIDLDLTICPTLSVYEGQRDLMRVMCAEWHDEYTWPPLWRFFQPNPSYHGSNFYYHTTMHEIKWKNAYRLMGAFLNEYKNRGGRVTVGPDCGYIYKIYGFSFIRELELLQEIGFNPLEVIRSATIMGAEALGIENEVGTIEAGKKADFVIVEENPLENLKVLYGTGAIRFNFDTRKEERVGGVKWTIKDGIVYDAKALLADVREIVTDQKKEEADATKK